MAEGSESRKTAVVTGASSGIGEATARALAKAGFRVTVGARRLDRLEALAGEIGGRALPLDVTDPASVESFAAAVLAGAGGAGLHLLVNNAGGSGYTAAKHGLKALTQTLRVELLGRPVRVTEVAPGLVGETEFSLVRFGGDAERARAVYQGVTPLTPEDVADCIVWAATRPAHVNIDEIVLRPLAQANSSTVHRR